MPSVNFNLVISKRDKHKKKHKFKVVILYMCAMMNIIFFFFFFMTYYVAKSSQTFTKDESMCMHIEDARNSLSLRAHGMKLPRYKNCGKILVEKKYVMALFLSLLVIIDHRSCKLLHLQTCDIAHIQNEDSPSPISTSSPTYPRSYVPFLCNLRYLLFLEFLLVSLLSFSALNSSSSSSTSSFPSLYLPTLV